MKATRGHGHINPHLPTTAFSGYWDDATSRPNLKPPMSPDTVLTNFARQPPEEQLKPAERRTPVPNLPAVIASLAIKYDLSDHEICKLAAELGGVRTHVDEAYKLLEINPPAPQTVQSPAAPKTPESRGPAPGAGSSPASSPQPDQKFADDDDPFEVVMEKRHVVVKAMRWLAEALTELSFVLPKPTRLPEALGAVDEALALVRATGDRATEQQMVIHHSDLNNALAEHKRSMEQQMLIRPTRQKLNTAEVAKVEAAIKAARGVLADAIKALGTAEELRHPTSAESGQLRQKREAQEPTMQQLLRHKREAQERALANHMPTGPRTTREGAKTPVGITTPWTTREEVPRAKKALAWDA
eukprot:jgi/Chrpa1/6505/Chrysochromulina_OHIO_Genome00018781-RA